MLSNVNGSNWLVGKVVCSHTWTFEDFQISTPGVQTMLDTTPVTQFWSDYASNTIQNTTTPNYMYDCRWNRQRNNVFAAVKILHKQETINLSIVTIIMSQIPKAKSSIPKPSLSQVATATGSQLDLLAGKNSSDRGLSRSVWINIMNI